MSQASGLAAAFQDLGASLIDVKDLKAGRDIHIHLESARMSRYLASKGPQAYRDYLDKPEGGWDSSIRGTETVDSLRTKLMHGQHIPPQPMEMTVRGTLFPAALLASGWWEKHTKPVINKVRWRNELQAWLFRGFEEWGPSWDFSWSLEHWESGSGRPYFIAQLGEGDEANSLPVLLSFERAGKLVDYIYNERAWGGIEVEVFGLLGHRRHFNGNVDAQMLELFGGPLNYCIWLDPENNRHGIWPLSEQPDIYSGYLWKCVAPRSLLTKGRPALNDVYFVWEHANFASQDAIRFGLDLLEHKVEYIQRLHSGDQLVLVQKSSHLVPGVPEWRAEDIYALLTGRKGRPL